MTGQHLEPTQPMIVGRAIRHKSVSLGAFGCAIEAPRVASRKSGIESGWIKAFARLSGGLLEGAERSCCRACYYCGRDENPYSRLPSAPIQLCILSRSATARLQLGLSECQKLGAASSTLFGFQGQLYLRLRTSPESLTT